MLFHHHLHQPVLKLFIYSYSLSPLSRLPPASWQPQIALYLMNFPILVASHRWSRAVFILCVWLTSLLLALL